MACEMSYILLSSWCRPGRRENEGTVGAEGVAANVEKHAGCHVACQGFICISERFVCKGERPIISVRVCGRYRKR